MTAGQIIELLELQPLPLEGGFYRETYRSADRLPPGSLPRFTGEKSAGTAIYYLLTPETFSAVHRLPTDEIFHLYLGGPVHMLQLWPDGSGKEIVIGSDLEAGQVPQVVVPAGTWQGSWLSDGAAFALLGTTMTPGFDFSDYEPGDRAWLSARYPAFARTIQRLT